MKQRKRRQLPRLVLSPPSRGRGLKPLTADIRVAHDTSPPSRGRGLKHIVPGERREFDVAPFTGAWIETTCVRASAGASASPPSRGRGLKLSCPINSLPNISVAPFTGAWIETANSAACASRLTVAPFTGAWIETKRLTELHTTFWRRPLHGGVD